MSTKIPTVGGNNAAGLKQIDLDQIWGRSQFGRAARLQSAEDVEAALYAAVLAGVQLLHVRASASQWSGFLQRRHQD